MFKSTLNKGFQVTFSNEITISVQFGKGNYCMNKNNNDSDFITECQDAEIAIWDKDGDYFNFGNGNAKGWVSPDEVAEWIAKIQTVKNLNQLTNL